MSQRRRDKRMGRIVRASHRTLAAFEGLDRRLLMSAGPGNPDITFNFDGRLEVEGDLANPGRPVSILNRADGFTYVLTELPGASGLPGISGSTSAGVAITRLTSSGTVDLTWGASNTGRFTFNVDLGVDGAVLLDAGVGNGIYIAGTGYEPVLGSGGFDPSGDFLLIKVTETGTTDFTYAGGQGYRRIDLDLADSRDDLVSAGIDSAGNVTLYGRYRTAQGSLPGESLIRLDASGNVVSGFGDAGSALASGGFRRAYFGTFSDNPGNLAVAPDGSFFVSRTPSSGPGVEVTRFTPAGLVDPGFTPTLLDSSVSSAQGLVLDGGNLFVGLTVAGDFRVYKLSASSGAANLSYGGVGNFTSFGGLAVSVLSVRMTSRGTDQLAVAFGGTSSSSPVSAVFGLTSGGFADFTFGMGINPIGTSNAPASLAVGSDPSGRVVAGASLLASPFFTAEWGATLSGFDAGGTQTYGGALVPTLGGDPLSVDAVHADAAGNVLGIFTTPYAAGGIQTIGAELTDRFGVRLRSTIFDSGRFRDDIKVAGVSKRADGKYVVVFSARDDQAGTMSTTVIVGVLNSDGTLDTTAFSGSAFASIAPAGDVGYQANSLTEIPGQAGYFIGGQISGSQRMILRLRADLSVDTSFGSAGLVSVGGVGTSEYNAVVIDESFRIYGVGTASPSGTSRVVVDRFSGLGTPDFGWGVSGSLEPYGSAEGLSATLSVNDRRIYIGVSSFVNPQPHRRPDVIALDYNTQALDSDFGSGGVVTLGALDGFSSGVRDVVLDPAGGIIVVGDVANKPLIRRIMLDGVVDSSYATSYSPPFDQFGKFNRVVLDKASRPVAVGSTGATGSSGARVGEMRRFGATEPVAPMLVSVETQPRARLGDLFGRLRTRIVAPEGLRITSSIFASAVEYTRADGSTAMAGLETVNSPDDGRTWDVVFTYDSGSGAFDAGDGGTYTFRLLANALVDDAGNQGPATTTTIAAITLNFSGIPGPGDPDPDFNSGNPEQFTSDLSVGELVQVYERADGTTYLLSNTAPITDPLNTSLSGAFVLTRLLPGGARDTSFGIDGRYVFSVFAETQGVMLMDLGVGNGFFVAGTAGLITSGATGVNRLERDFLLVKVTESGDTDLSFGGAGLGFRTYDLSGESDVALGAVLVGGGGVIMHGLTSLPGVATTVLRVDSVGEPVASFGQFGLRTRPGVFAMPSQHDFRATGGAKSIAIDTDGLLYVAGRSPSNNLLAVFSFDTQGTLNNSGGGGFDAAGVGQYTVGGAATGSSIVTTPLGSVLVGFYTSFGDVGVLSIDAAGMANDSFGGGDGFFLFNADSGLATKDFLFSVDLAAFSNDAVAVAATAGFPGGGPQNATNVATFVLSTSGTLDPSYNGGLVEIDLGSGAGNALISVTNGTVLAGGSRNLSSEGVYFDGLVSRFDLTGSLVTTFTDGATGPGRASLGRIANAAVGSVRSVRTNPDGSFFTVYVTTDPFGREAIGTRAYNTAGQAIGGTLLGGGTWRDYSVAGIFLRPDGTYLVVFSALPESNPNQTVFVVANYDQNGGLISSFGSGGFVITTPGGGDNRLRSMVDVGGTLLLVGREGGRPVLYRMNDDGVFIGTFLLDTAQGEAVAVQPDVANDRVYIAWGYDPIANRGPGDIGGPAGGGLPQGAVIERRTLSLLALDPTFGTAGRVRYQVSGLPNTVPETLLLDLAGNRVLLGGRADSFGTSPERPFLFGVAADTGQLDGSFPEWIGPSNQVSRITGLAADLDGGYLASGAIGNRPEVMKFSSSGLINGDYAAYLDPSFSHYGQYRGVVIDALGKPIVFGESGAFGAAPRPGILQRLTGTVAPAVPGVSVAASPGDPLFGQDSVRITLEYRAFGGRTIDQATISASNLVLLRDGQGEGAVSVVLVDQVLPDVVRVTYELSPASGGFDLANNGFYEILTSGTAQVRDSVGLGIPPTVVFSFSTNFVAPTASLALPPVPRVGDTALVFTVTYTAAAGGTIDPDTIVSGNLSAIFANTLALPVRVVSVSGSGQSVVVTYDVVPAGGVFNDSNIGNYRFDVGNDPVRDLTGTPVSAGVLGSLDIQYISPTAFAASVGQVLFGGTSATLGIRFTPGTGKSLDLSTIDGGEILIRRPDGSQVLAVLEQVLPAVPPVNGELPPDTVVNAIYRFTPIGSTFGFADVGQWEVLVVGASVRDTLNSAIAASSLSVFPVVFSRPTVSAVAPASPTAGAPFVEFDVTYRGSSGRGLDLSDLGADDIRFTLPGGGTSFASFVSFRTGADGSVVATYRFSPPGGSFGGNSGGVYAASVVEGAITDTLGVPVAAGDLFTFTFVGTGVPGALVSLSFPQRSYLPGDVIDPTVVLNNPLSSLPSQPFSVRFFIVIENSPLAFGEVAVSPLAAGETRTTLFNGRLSLPGTGQLAPGSYDLVARVVAADGSLGAPVSAPVQLVVVGVTPPRPGTLDPTFGGGDGIVTTFVPGPTITLVGSVAQPGSRLISGGFNSDGDFVLLRFNADGSPDTSFGVNGILTLDVSGGLDIATTITSDAQGRIVLGGTSQVGDTTVFSVVRFNADGTLDATFASGGILLYTPPGSQASLLRSVVTDRFGRPYLLGSIRAPQTTEGAAAPQGVVIRLAPSGLVDTSFGSEGVVSAALTDGREGVLPFRDGLSELTSLLLLKDRIIVGGYSGNSGGTASRFVLAGLTYNGRLDTRYGTRGVLDTRLGTTLDRVTVLLETPDGGIYAGGSRGDGSTTTAIVFRTTATGRIDRSFNRGQVLLLNTNTALGTVSSLLDSVNNTVLVTVATADSLAGAADGQIGTVVFRLTPAGANDPFFNSGAPQIIFDVSGITPQATGGLTGDFDSFVQSKQGATQKIEGGRVRSLASKPVTEGTSISIAQLSADGVDLLPVLSGSLPASLRPGFRGTLTLTVSNVGSLVANGRFSVTLVADGDSDVPLPAVTLSGRIAQGATRNFRVRFTLPQSTAPGTYQMRAELGSVPRSFVDVNRANDVAIRPGSFEVASSSARLAGAKNLLNLGSDTSNADDPLRLRATRSLFSEVAM